MNVKTPVPEEPPKKITQNQKDLYRGAQGMKMYILACFVSNCEKNQAQIKAQEEYEQEQYKLLDALRDAANRK